jgi:NAD(P)-dependent dehydrogenase (short-subunit alcohol dehydrogenase family)
MRYRELEGKVVLVTGGASGLGLAAGQGFAREGATVVLADLHEDCAVAEAALLGPGPAHLGLGGDVADERDVRAMVDATVLRFGRLDVLINSAGIPDTFQPTVDQDLHDVQDRRTAHAAPGRRRHDQLELDRGRAGPGAA